MPSAGQRLRRVLLFAWVKMWVKVVFRKVPGYIVKARASYQLQRGVPRDCQSHVGKKKWKEPGGKTLNEAHARVPAFIARTDQEIREARDFQTTKEVSKDALHQQYVEESAMLIGLALFC